MKHPALNECAAYTGAITFNDLPGPDDYIMRTSTVGQADMCPGRLAVPTAANEAMLFGTLVHALIEGQIAGETAGPSLAYSLLEQQEDEQGAPDLPALLGGPDKYAMWVGEAINLAVGWRHWCRTNLGWPLEGAITEQRLLAPIGYTNGTTGDMRDRHRVWLGGTADCILGDLMMDTKTTSGKGWYQGRADSQNQTQAYPWLAQRVLGLEVERFIYVVGNRSTSQWQSFEARISPLAQQSFLTRAVAVASMLEADCLTYHPRGADGRRNWFCSPQWCSAWDRCPARFLGDDKDMLTTIVEKEKRA